MANRRTRYSDEFKEAMVQKMLAPNSVPVRKLSQDTGVSDVTLYKWKKNHHNQGVTVPSKKRKNTEWSPAEKLSALIETASLNEAELSAYCRTRGIFKEQIAEWKQHALSGYQQGPKQSSHDKKAKQADKKRIKKLEREVARKDKALAEAAALLVLSKKWNAIWEESEDS